MHRAKSFGRRGRARSRAWISESLENSAKNWRRLGELFIRIELPTSMDELTPVPLRIDFFAECEDQLLSA